MNANDEITTVAAVTLTSKLRANCGRAGATIPNPSAMTKLAETSTQISEGSRGLRPAGSPAARVFIVESDGRCPRSGGGTYPRPNTYFRTSATSSLAAACTSARWSGPLNDSA